MTEPASKKSPERPQPMAAQVDAQVRRKLAARRRGAAGVWFGLGMMGLIGWSVVELATLAADGALPKQAAVLKKVCELLAAQQGKLRGYAQEVKQERISRSEVKSKL